MRGGKDSKSAIHYGNGSKVKLTCMGDVRSTTSSSSTPLSLVRSTTAPPSLKPSVCVHPYACTFVYDACVKSA